VQSCQSRWVLQVYSPVDYYVSPADCSRIVVHSQKLRYYFEPYAPVEYIDHHVRFAAPMRERFLSEGFILWVGVRTNLPPLVDRQTVIGWRARFEY
jgi:hypothetical protein